ncbi:zinc finger HIT domain-containing protein 1-like isoform X1 [Teleopsis dalmanni]|uniref:zinc finger HIT domain-containing protein 1-like isoform X1 n=1 Tax=Teleopsis dalmanni TaxID=139649 RepID=UPI0018CEC667|nr:zinc finger HIT domain-containing protein 1-like isoform X1 [Teleopsis dalmanni]XP_037945283.1 zinc finger HIT domain-containing protein 1-like isoform X1 [Teleopsis dalmanni]
MSNNKSFNLTTETAKQRALYAVTSNATPKTAQQKDLEEDISNHKSVSIMSKKTSKLGDNNGKQKKRKKRKRAHKKLRMNFQQFLDSEKRCCSEYALIYMQAAAPAPKVPPRKYCAVCGYYSNYTCTVCSTRFCSVPCMQIHQNTRCAAPNSSFCSMNQTANLVD